MDFKGLKLSRDPSALRRPWGIMPVELVKNEDTIQLTHYARVGWGGNGGFQMLNLAAQFLPKRIVLVGYDMQVGGGLHWHGKHAGYLNNPTAPNVERWRRVTDAAAETIATLGIEVINASPVSALTAYPKADFMDAISCC